MVAPRTAELNSSNSKKKRAFSCADVECSTHSPAFRVFGPDKKIVKPAQIALIDKRGAGAMITPAFCEDRKVGQREERRST
jgi:hypothetical protein